MRWSRIPALEAEVAAPIRKLWLEKSPRRSADRRIALNLSVSKERQKGRPFSKRNRGPGGLPRQSRKEATAWTAEKGGEPGPSKLLHPFQNWSVLEALMQIWRQDGLRGTSTAISHTDRWQLWSKAERLGMVNWWVAGADHEWLLKWQGCQWRNHSMTYNWVRSKGRIDCSG